MRVTSGWSGKNAKQRVLLALSAFFAVIIIAPMAISASPVSVTTPSLTGGTFQRAYSAALSASGGSAPYIFRANGLPTGLSVSGGRIFGTPTEAGTFTVTIAATDNASVTSAEKTLTLIVAPPTVTVGTASLAGGTFQRPYSFGLSVSGGSAPYRFSWDGLPTGLSVNGGIISGTPTQAGTFAVTITASDNTLQTNGGPFVSAPKTLTLTVAPPIVTVATTSLPAGTKGTSYGALLGASGGVGSYNFTASGLPQGLSVTTGGISGIPTQSGSFTVIITAADSTSVANGGPFKSAPRLLTLVITAGRPVSS